MEFNKGKNKKTIKKLIKRKLNEWLDSIDDHDLRKRVKSRVVVTGGSIASMLLGEKVNDYDIYFQDKETTLAIAKYYVDKFNAVNKGRVNRLGKCGKAYVLDCDDADAVVSERAETNNQAGHILNCQPGRVKIVIRSDGVATDSSTPEILERPFSDVNEALEAADEIADDTLDEVEKYKPIFLSSNAITLSGKVQLVVRFYGDPAEIHENYDFVHCTNYYDSSKDELVLRPEALQSLLARELRYQGSLYPVCSVIRTRKFLKRGWNINAGQYLKMMFQISKLDLTDISVLEDQLVGVDSAYFLQVIYDLQRKQELDPNFSIDSTYLATIVDRIF